MTNAGTKRALVTGGNRGIGEAIAAALNQRGYDVVIGTRDRSQGDLAARRLGVQSVHLDLTRPETFPVVVESVGGIDVLINNAGVLHQGSVLENPGHFEESIAVMVRGPYHLIRAVLPHMSRQKWGRIVNLSSGWGSFSEGLGGPNGYGVAKAALNALTLALSREVPAGIKINAMCPRWVRTRMGGPNATRSPEAGADTAIWLATLDNTGPNGGFFRDRRPIAW